MKKKKSFLNSITIKLIIAFIFVSVLSITGIAFVSFTNSIDALIKMATRQLNAAGELKKEVINDFFRNAERDLNYFSVLSVVPEAMNNFENAFEQGGINTANYKNLQQKYHKFFSDYVDNFGYYDFFLIAQDGDIVYTVKREAEFGTNLIKGKFKNTGLAAAFKKALKNAGYFITDIERYAPSNNEPAMFSAKQIKLNGKVIGVIALQIPLNKINSLMLKATGLGRTGETYLVGQDYYFRSHSRLLKKAGKADVTLIEKVETETVKFALLKKSGLKVIKDYRGMDVFSSYSFITIGNFVWAVIGEIDYDEILEPRKTLIFNLIVFSSILLSVVIIGTIFFSRKFTKPILGLTKLAVELSNGNLRQEKLSNKSKDEIGILINAFNKNIEGMQYVADVIEKVTFGDLSMDVKAQSNDDGLAMALIPMLEGLNDLVGEVARSVEHVNNGAEQISQTSQELSQGATEQASAVEQITASSGEISSQAQSNSTNTVAAKNLADQTLQIVVQASQGMQTMVFAMQEINESAAQIGKIVKVIDDIAFQINLLALNANVEAARAGKYGKGFAVVADEVRSLAVKSANSVKETTSMIEKAIKSVKDGSSVVESISSVLGQIKTSAEKTRELVNEVSYASEEQVNGTGEINKGLEEIQDITQGITASAEESAATAEELAAQASALTSILSKFKLKNKKSLTYSGDNLSN